MGKAHVEKKTRDSGSSAYPWLLSCLLIEKQKKKRGKNNPLDVIENLKPFFSSQARFLS
jgi:hypothetical protein